MNTKRIDIKNYLPSHFSEDDKLEYELLCVDSKRYFPDCDDFIVHTCVIAHINEKLGLRQPATEEDIENERRKHMIHADDLVLCTPYDPDFDMESTLKHNRVENMKIIETNIANSIEDIQEDTEDEI